MESLQSNLPHPQIISDSGESRFNQLERTLEQFQELDQMRSQFMDVKVPLELLDVLDQGNVLLCEALTHFCCFRENNPQVKYFLHRTYTECDPFIVGEYTWLRHRKKRASWRSKHQVLSMIEEMAIGGDYRPGMKRGVNRRLPRGQELWDTETIGHDIFKVHSKWKADEEDLDMPQSHKHPNFVYRKY
ncbi:hypothetical protein COOONC_25945 [Cooperia oncophora]